MQIKANGKFLIGGEYAVVDGAEAFTLPLKYGQTLVVTESNAEGFEWSSYEKDTRWFSATFGKDLNAASATDTAIAERLSALFQHVKNDSPQFEELAFGKHFEITADFNLQWGLGSSSTLVYALATYFGTNPYRLQYAIFGGSGFDVAAAGINSPFFFKKNAENPIIETLNWAPAFSENLLFVYLGKKMNSRTSMKEADAFKRDAIKETISELVRQLPLAAVIEDFENLLNQLEELTAAYTGKATIKSSLFSDYPHSVKSLGAWGGDFVLVTTRDKAAAKEYFSQKDLTTIFEFEEIVHPNILKK